MSSGGVLWRMKQVRERIMMGISVRSYKKRRTPLTFKWRSGGHEGLSPELSKEKNVLGFRMNNRYTHGKAVPWEMP